MRVLAFAVVVALGASAAALADDPAPPADGAATPASAQPQPKKSKSGPSVDEADFKRLISDDPDSAWSVYQNWPQDWTLDGKTREQWALEFNQMKDEPKSPEDEAKRREFLVESRDLFKAEIERQKTAGGLGNAIQRAGQAASNGTGQCPEGKVLSGTDCVDAVVQGSVGTGKTDTATDSTPAGTQIRGGLAVGVPPVPDAKPAKRGAVMNDNVRVLLNGAALGGIAGALFGVGLLPLLGPIGILLLAAAGALMMAATRVLSNK